MTDDPNWPTVPGDHGQPVAVPDLTSCKKVPVSGTITVYDDDGNIKYSSNRWAAFTDDELRAIRYWSYMADVGVGPLGEPHLRIAAEITAEIERRKT